MGCRRGRRAGVLLRPRCGAGGAKALILWLLEASTDLVQAQAPDLSFKVQGMLCTSWSPLQTRLRSRSLPSSIPSGYPFLCLPRPSPPTPCPRVFPPPYLHGCIRIPRILGPEYSMPPASSGHAFCYGDLTAGIFVYTRRYSSEGVPPPPNFFRYRDFRAACGHCPSAGYDTPT